MAERLLIFFVMEDDSITAGTATHRDRTHRCPEKCIRTFSLLVGVIGSVKTDSSGGCHRHEIGTAIATIDAHGSVCDESTDRLTEIDGLLFIGRTENDDDFGTDETIDADGSGHRISGFPNGLGDMGENPITTKITEILVDSSNIVDADEQERDARGTQITFRTSGGFETGFEIGDQGVAPGKTGHRVD